MRYHYRLPLTHIKCGIRTQMYIRPVSNTAINRLQAFIKYRLSLLCQRSQLINAQHITRIWTYAESA